MRTFFYTLMVLACTMLASCSSEDEPNWQENHPEIDKTIIDGLRNGSLSKRLYCTGMECFYRETIDDEWQESKYLLVGHVTAPDYLYIHDGKYYYPFSILEFSVSDDRYKISLVWDAYEKVKKVDVSFYIYRSFVPDIDDLSLTGNYDYNYTITALSDSRIILDELPYFDQFLIKYTYELTDLSEAKNDLREGSTPMAFESDNAVYQFVIDCAREEFGDVVDFNKIFGEKNYSIPVIDLNELQESLDNNHIR